MNDAPLEILLTDPHLRGGGQVTYLTRLAQELTRMGHRVTMGCKPGSVLVERAAEAGCEVLPDFTFKGGLRPRAWLSDTSRVRRYITQRKPDLIHVNGSQDHWVCGLANRSLGTPITVLRTRHNTYTVKNSWPNRVLNRHWTDYQIVVCDVVRRGLAQHAAFDSRRLCTIHNGVDAEAFRPDPRARDRARREFGYGEKHIVCGIAARLVEAKGHVYLFRAFRQLQGLLPQLRLLVLGQGDLEPQLQNLAAELGIAERVHFAGFREDMPQCTQAFDIAVLPSVDCDTSSFSLKEEMAAEKPVIASDYGGLKEIVSDGVEGIVVPAGTVEPLAAAIRRLADNPSARQRMGETGRKRVLREFTVQVFAERTVAAYRRAMEVHRSRMGDQA